MSPPRRELSRVLTRHSVAREQIYLSLVADPSARWSVTGLAQHLLGVSAEAVRTTLYLLESSCFVGRVAGQRHLAYRLTDGGAQALREVLHRWRGATAPQPSTSPHMRDYRTQPSPTTSGAHRERPPRA